MLHSSLNHGGSTIHVSILRAFQLGGSIFPFMLDPGPVPAGQPKISYPNLTQSNKQTNVKFLYFQLVSKQEFLCFCAYQGTLSETPYWCTNTNWNYVRLSVYPSVCL